MVLVKEDHVMSKAISLLEAFGQVPDPCDAQGNWGRTLPSQTFSVVTGSLPPSCTPNADAESTA